MSSPTASADGTILVTGATGTIGGALVGHLQEQGVPCRVMCRRQEQLDDFAAQGVPGALGDFVDVDSLRRAMTGCEQLFLLAPGGPDQFAGDRNAIDAARVAGVRHVVKVSTVDANPDSAIPWARDHALADAYLRASGLAWTRLAPGAFMKNLLTEAAAVRRGFLPQTSSHGATAWIDAADIGAAAARVLTDAGCAGGPGDAGRGYLLTATPATSYPQIAEIMTATLGRRVRYLQIPAPLMFLVLRLSGTPGWQARGLVHQFVDVVRHGHDNGRLTTSELAELLGHEPTGLVDFVTQHRDELLAA